MAFTDAQELALQRRFGMHWGTVINNEDQEGVGRVLVQVTTVTSKRGAVWAAPVGYPAGYEDYGAHMLPRQGSQVLVGFIQGNLEEAFYIPGTQPVSQRLAAVAARDKVKQTDLVALETKYFQLVIDDDAKTLRIGNKADTCYLEIDHGKGMIELKAKNQFTINGKLVDVKGLMVQLQERVVSVLGGKQIA